MIVISVPFVGTPYFQQNTLKTSGAVFECGKSFNEKGDYIPDGDFD